VIAPALPPGGYCDECGTQRPFDELVAVTRIRDGWRRLICRSTVSGSCFRRNVGGGSVDRIELATPTRSSPPH